MLVTLQVLPHGHHLFFDTGGPAQAVYRQAIGSLPVNGSGGGSCTHGGEAYEAHLNLILPAVELVESAGNAPTSTCLQGRCILCLPRPQREIGKSPWCCPRQAEFWKFCCTGWYATYWKIKRAGSFHASGPCHFNKEQTPPGDLVDPSPRFHGGCFGV